MPFASGSSVVVGAAEGSRADTRYIVGDFQGGGILVPLLTPAVPAVTDQLRVAATLARPTDAPVYVVDPLARPGQTPRTSRFDPPEHERTLLEWAFEEVSPSTGHGNGRSLSTRNLVRGLLATTDANDVDTLVVPSGDGTGRLRRGLAERLALRADCDVVTVNGQRGFEPAPSILLGVAGGPHSGVATDVAMRIASDCDAWVDVLHVIPTDPSSGQRERAEATVRAAAERIDRPETTSTWILEADDSAGAIVEQSAYYELTVVGAPTKGPLRRLVTGSTNRSIRKDARSVVISARSNG
jgi:nucleotide-binding universal stress UspA family protein